MLLLKDSCRLQDECLHPPGIKVVCFDLNLSVRYDRLGSQSVENGLWSKVELQPLIHLARDVRGPHPLRELRQQPLERELLAVVESCAYFEPDRRAVDRRLESRIADRNSGSAGSDEEDDPPTSSEYSERAPKIQNEPRRPGNALSASSRRGIMGTASEVCQDGGPEDVPFVVNVTSNHQRPVVAVVPPASANYGTHSALARTRRGLWLGCQPATADLPRRMEIATMSGSKNEFVGGIKEGLGKLTGDEGLEAEGKVQKTGGKAERKTSGAAHEVKGNVKKAAGKLLDSPTLQAEGEADRVRGKVERA
jgi:uncharacterized protein YjbJ (UPF0337 family)